MAQDRVERGGTQEGGPVLPGPEDDVDPAGDGGVLGRQRVSRPVEHRRGRVQQPDLVAAQGQVDRPVAGPAPHIGDARRRWWKVGLELASDQLPPDRATEGVVMGDEAAGQVGVGVRHRGEASGE